MRANLSYQLLQILLPLGIAACSDASGAPSQDGEQGAQSATRKTATATIENSLPADGCSFPVRIGDVAYAPDAATLAEIRERSWAFGETSVRVEYRLTGRVGRVECGFNTHRDLPEVSLVFLDS